MNTESVSPQYPWITEYLRDYAHWDLVGENDRGSLWESPVGDFLVPRQLDDDLDLARSVIFRIAGAQGVPPEELGEDILYGTADVLDLRVAGESVGRGWIPLQTAAVVIERCKDALRAAATTAFGARPDVHNYSAVGDSVLSHAQMGHTKDGSFIFPVVVRLPKTDPTRPVQLRTDGEPDVIESNERRVTRTFSEALSAIEKNVNPGSVADSRLLDRLVTSGVSRQLCLALAEVVGESKVASFTAEFRWARRGPKAGSLPKSLEIGPEKVGALNRFAEALRDSPAPEENLFTGKIIRMMRGATDRDPHYLTLQTVRRGRLTKIDLAVDRIQHDAASPWYLAGETVRARGTARRVSGGWLIDHPSSLGVLDLQPEIPAIQEGN